MINIDNIWMEQYIDSLQIYQRWVNELGYKNFNLEKRDLSHW